VARAVSTGNANAAANAEEAIMLRTGSLLTLVVSWLFVSPALGSDLIAPVSFQADTAVTASVPFAIASSAGSQTSQIQGASMQATGDISAEGESFDYDAFTTADGQSHFEVTFDLTGPASFTLSGEISASGPQCSTTVALDGPSGPIAAISAMNQTTPILETGTMEPGTYTLVADADGRAFGDFFIFFDALGSYDVLFTVTPITGVPESGPDNGSSFVVAPNPFREQTTISHRIPGTMAVDASIFDLQGRLVRKLAGFEGDPTLSWDGRNRRGELVHPGVYFVRLEAGDEVHRLKVTRIR
jgi:hypothetical protein